MKQWYHAKPKGNGSACSFYLNDEENSFFASILRQKSWDASRRVGSFHKDDPNEKVIVKFSCKEICAIINSLENKTEFSGYHGSNQIVRFTFGPYYSKGEDRKQLGYSFIVNKESKEDSTNKQTFLMGFDFDEGMELLLFLKYLVNRSFDNERKLRAKARQKYNKSTNKKVEKPASQQENEEELVW
jgi:hypothetical protein|tara:strand:+ start:1142 stop:1699 length:558 start_codon:yes stop_codon:yes gene_type:complete